MIRSEDDTPQTGRNNNQHKLTAVRIKMLKQHQALLKNAQTAVPKRVPELTMDLLQLLSSPRSWQRLSGQHIPQQLCLLVIGIGGCPIRQGWVGFRGVRKTRNWSAVNNIFRIGKRKARTRKHTKIKNVTSESVGHAKR
jgi:hypothetical protein